MFHFFFDKSSNIVVCNSNSCWSGYWSLLLCLHVCLLFIDIKILNHSGRGEGKELSSARDSSTIISFKHTSSNSSKLFLLVVYLLNKSAHTIST